MHHSILYPNHFLERIILYLFVSVLLNQKHFPSLDALNDLWFGIALLNEKQEHRLKIKLQINQTLNNKYD